jgi:heavy metal sensor kinase
MLNSIRIRLTLWFSAILALILIAFAVAAYLFLGYSVNRQTDRTLSELSHSFVDMIESERSEKIRRLSERDATAKAVREAMEDLRFRSYQIFVFDSTNTVVSPAGATPDRLTLGADQITSFVTGFSGTGQESAFFDVPANGGEFRLLAIKYHTADEDLSVVFTHPLNEQREVQGRFLGTLVIAVPVALLLACFGGYFLARKALAPVVSMSSKASEIGATNLNERLPVINEKDELGNLTLVFNSLLARLEASFENQKRFMADASHELRTPLAIVRGESEIALSKDDRSTGEYKESLAIVHDESKRLTKIVEDLFTIARADAGQFRTNFTQVYLDEIAGDAVRSMRVLADRKDIDLTFSSRAEMPFEGDDALLHRLFLNLIDNAVKYSRRGGSVSVACGFPNGNYRIEVRDSGPGIPEEDRLRIFDRFYRLDKARSRAEDSSTSGAGLGLPIAQWIAEIHVGNIRVSNSDTGGSIFVAEFPSGVDRNGRN